MNTARIDLYPRIPKLNYDYELAKISSNKAKDAVLVASSTNWLPRCESHRIEFRPANLRFLS